MIHIKKSIRSGILIDSITRHWKSGLVYVSYQKKYILKRGEVVLKYRGTYRVSYEFDSQGKPAEFTFIPCCIKRGANIYRYSETKLCVYIPRVCIAKRLVKNYGEIFSIHLEGDCEVILIFDEKDIKKTEDILKIYKKGKNISYKSKKNLRFPTVGDI